MAVLFDFYHTPSPKTIESEEKFHARVVGGQIIHLETLVDHISRRCTLTKGDIQAVLSELGDELATELSEGNRVSLPGIGSFYLSLSAPHDASPAQTRAQSIQLKRVEFRADQQLKEQLQRKIIFERSREKTHSSSLSQEEIDVLLTAYFKENAFITRTKFAELCQFTRMTALRHLKRLLDDGRLTNINTPRNPVYEPVKGCYGKK